jgi:hypothetical protein
MILPNYLTQDDVNNYGTELLDVSQRAALHSIVPYLQQHDARFEQLARDNADMRARLARKDRLQLDREVEAAVPNYRDFDRDPRWHQWLLRTDPMSGQIRQQLLNQAISAGDTSRVVRFFRGFEAEPASSFENRPAGGTRAPSRARPAGQTIYDNASIARLYDRRRKGLISDDKWPAIEADIFAAQREGRVQAAPFLTK